MRRKLHGVRIWIPEARLEFRTRFLFFTEASPRGRQIIAARAVSSPEDDELNFVRVNF